MRFKIKIALVALVWLSYSCTKEAENGPSVNFSRYISVGNSLTAGVSNNGLYNSALDNAYPNLIAKQLQGAGGGAFVQARFSIGQENGTGYLKLGGYNGLIPIINQVLDKTAYRNTSPPRLTKYTGDNQNLGIPFMKMAEIDSPSLIDNVFFERLLPEGNPATSYLQMVQKAQATFFTCWLGNNDLLSYASSGGTRPITSMAVFETNTKKLLDQLTANGAKGVVANIGDITAAPTISLISNYRPLFASSKFYVTTKTGLREGTSKDLLLPPGNLSSIDVTSLASRGTKITEPWPDNEVLDTDEQLILANATKEFNNLLKQEASTRNLAFMDAYAFMEKLRNNIDFNGDVVNTAFLTGGIFSLDGAHLTPKGYAFTANEFLKAINEKYKTNLPLLDTKLYKGVVVEN
jgi:hypothetical protein